jgi:hypothetical protein
MNYSHVEKIVEQTRSHLEEQVLVCDAVLEAPNDEVGRGEPDAKDLADDVSRGHSLPDRCIRSGARSSA